MTEPHIDAAEKEWRRDCQRQRQQGSVWLSSIVVVHRKCHCCGYGIWSFQAALNRKSVPQHGVAQCLSSGKAVTLVCGQRSEVACLGAKITNVAIIRGGECVHVARLPDDTESAPMRSSGDCNGRGT